MDDHGFVQSPAFAPLSTSRPGVYACGVAQGPKDIPETMVEASGAACLAAAHLSATPDRDHDPEQFPPEREVSGQEPQVGVFVCDCGTDIGGVIDVPALVEHAKTLPGVKHAEAVGYGCSRESLEHIRQAIEREGLNRVVVGGCSPRTHEKKFQDTLRMAGLNPFLLDIANLRDQDTWVHHHHPEQAFQKAKDLLQMSLGGAREARPLTQDTVSMHQDILVVGGGVAGMTAALELADRGFQVHLVERNPALGGHALVLHRTLEGDDIQAFVRDLVERTHAHDNIEVLLGALVVDHAGVPGRFTTGLQIGRQMYYRQIQHGVTILATGALANRPPEYGLDELDPVMTQRDLDEVLELRPEQTDDWQSVVMIQCVGSRDENQPNCSRICCQSAVKNALRLLDRKPETKVFVLYRDIRTLGTDEDYYMEARRRGAIFVPFDPEHKPRVENGDERPTVTFLDPILQDELRLKVDQVVLSTGMRADDETTEDLASIFHLPRTEDGYFLEDHVKLRPVDLPVPGFFVAGTAHGPKSIAESVAQAEATAARAQAMLAREVIQLDSRVARVQAERCAACLICVRSCPYAVPVINPDGHSEIDPALCHGCGVCAAECPARAIELMQFEDGQVVAKLSALLESEIAS